MTFVMIESPGWASPEAVELEAELVFGRLGAEVVCAAAVAMSSTIESPGGVTADCLVEGSPGWARAASKAEKMEREGMVGVLFTLELLVVVKVVGNAAAPGWAIGAR